MGNNIKKQRGAAAIFIVVFFAVLISIIALSFLRIALQDQRQATNNDLSQSAYDSADAGLEDAKRALSWYNAHCPQNSAPAAADADNCTDYNTAFSSSERCNLAEIATNTNTLPGTVPVSGTTEVKIANSGADETLEQAYTCVDLETQTKDYKDTAENGKSDILIPLRTVNNDSFDTIELNWFTFNDAGTDTPAYPTAKQLPALPTTWPSTAPPVMRFQLIPTLRGNININDIDADTRTAFLYPNTGVVSDTVFLSEDNGLGLPADQGRYKEKTSAPQLAKCVPTFTSGYACSVKIKQLPMTSGSTPTSASPSNTDYYLRLTAFYKKTDYQIRLFGNNGTDLRLFDNVQPKVDSTGRANDVFRRVESRVINNTNDNPLTDGGFDITKGVCKDFNVPVYRTNCAPALVEPTDPAP